jgi:hypothetical protein
MDDKAQDTRRLAVGVAMTAWLGVFVAFPAWAIWLARMTSVDPIPHRIPSAMAGS